MKTRRERPSQRLSHRVDAPLNICIAGQWYVAADWSLGGFHISDFIGEGALGDTIECALDLPFQGFDLSFSVQAEIRRLTPTGDLGVSFVEMGEREEEIMRHFIDNLVRGSMTSVDDTILRIDTPVTPVSTEPDPNPMEQMPVHRLPIKTIVMTTLYAVAGVAVLSYAGLVIHSNFFRLEVQTAVVGAPVESILATSDGRIAQVVAEQGQDVFQRSALILIEDAKLQQAIDMAKVRIDRTTLNVLSKQQELEAEEARLKDYRSVALAEIERASSAIRGLEQQATLAARKRQRMESLLASGWTTRSKTESSQSAHSALMSQLEQARSMMHQRRQLLDSVEQGRFYNGTRMEGRVAELQAELNLSIDEIMLAKDEHSALLRHRKRLTLVAPTNGRLIRLHKNAGSSVRRGEEIALFERDEARTIKAYLTQEEILRIGLGDEASIYFPSLDRQVQGIVSGIDRTETYVDEMNSRYEWRGPKDRAAIVTLDFLDIDHSVVRRQFAPGLPAVVIFERRSTDNRGHNVRQKVRELTSEDRSI